MPSACVRMRVQRGRIEDIVVDKAYRGQNLGLWCAFILLLLSPILQGFSSYEARIESRNEWYTRTAGAPVQSVLFLRWLQCGARADRVGAWAPRAVPLAWVRGAKRAFLRAARLRTSERPGRRPVRTRPTRERPLLVHPLHSLRLFSWSDCWSHDHQRSPYERKSTLNSSDSPMSLNWPTVHFTYSLLLEKWFICFSFAISNMDHSLLAFFPKNYVILKPWNIQIRVCTIVYQAFIYVTSFNVTHTCFLIMSTWLLISSVRRL